MIAKVIPLKRLPKTLDLLDYAIPPQLENRAGVGQLVRVPFRKSELFGLIFDFEKNEKPQSKQIRFIGDIEQETAFYNKNYLFFLRDQALLYGVPLSYMAKLAFAPLKKRKLKNLNLSPCLEAAAHHGTKMTFELYETMKEREDMMLSQSEKGPILILVPEVRQARDLSALIGTKLKKNVCIWHGELTEKEQFHSWMSIRNKEHDIIVGTRSAVFLPFQTLQSILIDQEQDYNHKQWDQSPRFHTKDLAPQLARICGADLIYASHSPSINAYYYIKKGVISLSQKKEARLFSERIKNEFSKKIRISHANSSSQTQDKRNILTEAVREKIIALCSDPKQIHKDMFFFIQRKGYANTLICLDCGYTYRCADCALPLCYDKEMSALRCNYCPKRVLIPKDCDRCHSTQLKTYGSGTQALKQEIQDLLSEFKNFELLIMDSDTEISKNPIRENKDRIVVGTELAFGHLRWENIALAAYIDFDRQLSFPEYGASERVWQRIQNIRFHMPASSNLYVQTQKTESIIIQSLGNPEQFYEDELKQRLCFSYPPYSYILKCFYGDANEMKAEREANRTYTMIKNRLTENGETAKISHPIRMHPFKYRKKHWFAIIVKWPTPYDMNRIAQITQSLPGSWKLDPNPISILSP